MTFGNCPEDGTFGPAVQSCRGGFDFTMRFEDIFLSLIPATIFILAAAVRICVLVRRVALGPHRRLLQVQKITATSLYLVLHVSLLGLGIAIDKSDTVLLSAAILCLVSALAIIVLSALEHTRSRRPSILLNGFLFVMLLLDIARARTLWLSSVATLEIVFSSVFTAVIATKVVLVILESQTKTPLSALERKDSSPEEASGICSLASFFWITPILTTGSKEVLDLDDLFQLPGALKTELLQDKLDRRLSAQGTKNRHHKFKLASILARAFATQLLLPAGPRISLIGFRFSQPFLIRAMLAYMQTEHAGKNEGYGLIGATVLIYTGIAISTALYWYLHERALCMFRGALAGVIYRKTTLSMSSGDPAALTLMSTDIERIRLGFLNLHEFWANTIEVALASWLLERQLGAAFVAPLVIVLVCISVGAYVNRFTSRRQKTWMGKIQRRVGWTAKLVSSMKHLKISGLAGPVAELVQAMRVDELVSASKFRMVYVIVVTCGYVPMALSPPITFAVTSRHLDVTSIFTSLSYLLLLGDPLGYIFQNTPHLLAAFACLDRIQNFLGQKPRVDNRGQGDHNSTFVVEDAPSEATAKATTMITISNGCFGWKEGVWALTDINVRIPAFGLTMVVGPVGAGKSTLCKAILGEVPFHQGAVRVSWGLASPKVGFCDQSPFLLNATIRQNIIGFSPFNNVRYEEVLEATMLKPDLYALPQRDDAEVGSNGLTLSGGQRQRVSMARALYLDTNFYLFDDILSGLDATTEDEVFRRVFGKGGLLQRRRAAAVLCTHNVRRLQFADHIVALDSSGAVSGEGPFSAIPSAPGYTPRLDESESTATEDDIAVLSRPVEVPAASSSPNRTIRPITYSGEDKTKDPRRMRQNPDVYKHYLGSLGRGSIVAFTVFGLGWGFFYNWSTVWLKFWSDDFSSPPMPRPNGFYIGLYGLFQLSYLVSLFLSFMICFRSMIQLSGAKLHKLALDTVISAPLSFFARTDVGVITTLFSQDMALVDNELPIALTNLVMDVFNALGMVAVIASSSYWLTISYPFIFAVLYAVQKFYLRTSRQLRLLDLEAKSPLYTHFIDTISGVVSYRAFGWIPEAISINDALLDRSQRPTYLLAMVQRWLGFVLQLVVAVLAVGVISLGTQLRFSTGLTGASLVTLMTFGDILNYIIRWWTQLEISLSAVGRLKNLSEEVVPEGSEGMSMPPAGWPSKGEIILKNVTASYGRGPESGHASEQLALRSLDFSIKPAEKVAICGRSGSGKSSIILLLLRILEPLPDGQGNVIIDNLPLNTLNCSTIRERVIAVPQEPVFLPDGSSFKANMDPFNVATDDECRAALERAGLWDLVEKRGGLTEGLWDNTLSQGQKQLFSLARAILRRRIRLREYSDKSPLNNDKGQGGVLLLDEPNSSVDYETGRGMLRIVLEEFESYTIVMVSHRLEGIRDFDTVIVTDGGSVVEKGCPASLLEDDSSRLRALRDNDTQP